MAFNDTIPNKNIKEVKEYNPECTPSLSLSENNFGKEILYYPNSETPPMFSDFVNEKTINHHKSKKSINSKTTLSNPNLIYNKNNSNIKFKNKKENTITIIDNKTIDSTNVNYLFHSTQQKNGRKINKTNNFDFSSKKKSTSIDEKTNKIEYEIHLNKKNNITKQLEIIIDNNLKRKIYLKNNSKNKKVITKNYSNTTLSFKNNKNRYNINNQKFNKNDNLKNSTRKSNLTTNNNKRRNLNPQKIIDDFLKNIMDKYNKNRKTVIKNKSCNNFFNEDKSIEKKIINCRSIKKKTNYKMDITLTKKENIKKIDKNRNRLTSYSKLENNFNKYFNIINLKTMNNKKNKKGLNISHLGKIMKKNGLFYVLTFLDDYDIINILEIKNKKLRLLISKSISDAYYFPIKNNIKKYKEYFEIIKCVLIYSKVKDSLKIDLMMNIRFNDLNNKITLTNQKYFQLIYLYEYLKKNKNDKNLLYDYYQFDLYNEKYDNKNENNKKFKGIYLTQEISLFGLDKNDELINIQPVLPFKINDKGIFNFEIYSCNNCFINPSSLKIKLKSMNLEKNIKELENNYIDNIRISEYEYICKYWKKIKIENNKIIFLNDIKKFFDSYFLINDIFYDSFGLVIYKFNLTSKKCGTAINKNLNINIIIKDSNDYIENEIKKNNILFERNNTFEIRIGDTIIFYLIMKENKI